jgi:hypothetical protein
VLVGRGWADLTPIDDRDDCFVVGEVNHRALFGRVAGVVHHGGAGTTTTATRAGAPQVVIPQAADQPYWAARVADPEYRRGTRRSEPNLRVPVGRAQDRPSPKISRGRANRTDGSAEWVCGAGGGVRRVRRRVPR